MLHLLFILMLNISPATRSDRLFVASDSLFDSNGILDLGNRDGWRFHPGDDLNWANPDFDDSDWMLYKPSGLTQPIPDSLWQGYGWFRFRFATDSTAYMKATYLYFSTWGAAEVYLDGKLVRKFGVFSTDLQGETRFRQTFLTLPSIVLPSNDSRILAVRYSYHKGQLYKNLLGKYAGTFGFGIGLATDYFNQLRIKNNIKDLRNFFILGTMMLLIVLLHLFLFVLFPAERSNLYIAIVAILLFSHIITSYQSLFIQLDNLQYILFMRIPFIVLILAALSMFPLTINSMFKQKPRRVHKMLIWLFPVFALANFIISGPGNPNVIITVVFVSGIIFFSFRVLIQAWRNKQKGVWFVAGGFLSVIVSVIVWILYVGFTQNFSVEFNRILTYIIYASIPLGLTAFMASRFRDLYTHLEQKVKERTLELQQSLEELRSTQTQLIHSEKMASLGALTAGIAHEIQNPLNFVNNFSEVGNELIDEMKNKLAVGSWQSAVEIADDLRQNLEKINLHGKRADAIVKGMLQHSRTSTGQKEPTDVNALAGEYLRLAYHGMRAKDKNFNADFKTDFDPDLPKIMVVPQDIGRVLLNLINNAFYAVAEKQRNLSGLNDDYKPTVTVSIKNLGLQIEISARDNGDGIPEEIKNKIFQPFFTTKPAGQGTGLGLSLAYDIVKAHGGEIQMNSVQGEGSEFTISLPCSNLK